MAKKRPPTGPRAAPKTGAPPATLTKRFPILQNPWVAPLALVLLTAAAYARSLAVPIIGGDDFVYLFRDARLENLTGENIRRILTQPFFANFHPLTTMTYAFDRAVWGSWIPGFHITQVVLYLVGVLGLYFLFARLLRSRGAAFAAAAIYAVHPVHVESVAWLASRKDVVCLFFYAYALLTYASYASTQNPRWGMYALSLVLGGAAMLSKGYAAALPGVLLAYDYCFTQRITARRLLDKVPFVFLAGATLLLTVHAQDRDSALVQAPMAFGARLMILLKVFALYVWHSLVPVKLSAFYTVGGRPVEPAMAFLGALLAGIVVTLFFLLRKRNPAAAFGIALFILPLATVMNVFFTLRIWMTDRYLFFPTIGSSLAVVAVVRAAVKQGRAQQARAPARHPVGVLAILAAMLIHGYAALTIARIGVWMSGVTLWSDVLRKELRLEGSGPVTAAELSGRTLEPSAGAPIVSLIQAYRTEGKDAAADALAASIGNVAGGGGEYGEMAAAQKEINAGQFDAAIRRLQPIANNPSAWLAPEATGLIGLAQRKMGDTQAAAVTFQHAFDLYRQKGRPVTDAYIQLGTIEFRNANYPEAANWYQRAVKESPSDAKAAFHYARALEESGHVPDAMAIYKKIASGALPVLPESQFTILDVELQMAVAAQKLGKSQEAAGYFEDVLRRAPDHPKRDAIRAQIAALRAGTAK